MEKWTREQVEAELERAKRRFNESNPIAEGQPYPTLEEIYPRITNKDLREVNLSGLDLSNGNLSYSDLRGTNLTNTLLVLAELNHANLRNTIQMEGTDLRGASMSFAKLQGADLSKAILEGDNPPLSENTGPVVLHNAQYDNETEWPRGFNPDDFGAARVGS